MNLLFVCTHNRCRSILAEAIANHVGCGRLCARSAGSSPAGEVHPLTLRYLAERGIGIDRLRSKGWNEVTEPAPDIVVTVCDRAAGEACPLWLGAAEKVHWGLPDPSAVDGSDTEKRDAFLAVIDILESRIGAVLALVEAGAASPQLVSAMREMH
jgi:arsenate reductase